MDFNHVKDCALLLVKTGWVSIVSILCDEGVVLYCPYFAVSNRMMHVLVSPRSSATRLQVARTFRTDHYCDELVDVSAL